MPIAIRITPGGTIIMKGPRMDFKKKMVTCVIASMAMFGCGSSDSTPHSKLLLNEFKANIPEDKHALQYIELRGQAGETLTNTWLLVIDGDDGSAGHVDYARNLDGVIVGSNGLIIIKNADEYTDVVPSTTTLIDEPLIRTYDPDVDGDEYEDGLFEHDAVTYAIVRSSAGFDIGDDLDSDNDGHLELPGDSVILDSVGSQSGGEGFVYSGVVLTQSASDPDAATRFQDDLTPNSIDAWANGDIYEDPSKDDDAVAAELIYDTLEASANLPPKAKLTPGSPNFRKAPFVLLNEIVTTGSTYVELLSNPSQDLTGIYLVTLSDDIGTVSMGIDLSGYSAKEAGLTVIHNSSTITDAGSALTQITADLAALSPGKTAVSLIYSPAVSLGAGMDLDTDNDGILELPDGAIVIDNFGWGGTLYSDVTVSEAYAIHGATRYKDNRVCSASAWTCGELKGYNYDPARSRNIPEKACITPGHVNVAKETAMLIKPTLETNRSTVSNPDADDVAIWIHPTDATKSMVIATQKNAGYSVYNTAGETLLDALPGDNRYNNVDVMYGFDLNGTVIDIALFSDRNNNRFAVYKIQETEPYIVDITDPAGEELFDAEAMGKDTAYGEGVYKSPVSGKFYAFATQNGTWNAAQFELVARADNTVGWTKVRHIILGADDDDKHAEGIVVDQEYGKVYIAQEEVGIYTLDAEPGAVPFDIALDETELLIEAGDHDIVEDLEGMTIYYKDNGEGYVFISSQGNTTYGIFNRTSVGTVNTYITAFAIVDDMDGIDGTQHTDSLDVTNVGISSQFPNGAFIVQDGTDTETDPKDTGTNFKWMKWDDIATGLGDTDFTSSYDPRNPMNRR